MQRILFSLPLGAVSAGQTAQVQKTCLMNKMLLTRMVVAGDRDDVSLSVFVNGAPVPNLSGISPNAFTNVQIQLNKNDVLSVSYQKKSGSKSVSMACGFIGTAL